MLFFFNDTATTEIYTLSLHDALPISPLPADHARVGGQAVLDEVQRGAGLEHPGHLGQRRPRIGDTAEHPGAEGRSEEHTSELQSRQYLVCRLLLEKKNT